MASQHTDLTGIPRTEIPACLAQPARPACILLDTDMGNDVDDALALGLLHALENRGACRLLAVTLTNPEPRAGAYVAAVNAFYGRGEIPVGISPGAPFVRPSAFLKMVDLRDAAGRPLFPNTFDAAGAPHSVELMRRTLAAAPGNSVVIAQIGFSTNTAALLDSPPDAISPLSGRELIEKKVRFLSIMSGAFSTVQSNNHWLEFNIVYDMPSARRLVAGWPTPVVWSGAEVGEVVPFPAHAVDEDFSYAAHHPLRESYQLFRPTPHERPTWDLTTVLYAVYPDRGYFDLSVQGTVEIMDDGFSRFHPGKGARDRYLIISKKQAGCLRGLFAGLVTEPPKPMPGAQAALPARRRPGAAIPADNLN
ncbi:MAG: nucleoside hydrolase [Opitutaceae bacterium]|jgi:inosine-uridine nucleoside N-ribohydrolase|nr:nucleoside hydrolase [Opitutaceae bacterium]